MKVSSTILSIVLGLSILLIPTMSMGDVPLVSELFNGTSGIDITSLGWSNIGSGQIVVSDTVVDKGSSACKTGNTAALYEKNLTTAQSIGTGDVVTLSAVVKVAVIAGCSNRAGAGIKTTSGVYMMDVYKSAGAASTSVYAVWLPGAASALEFTLPQADTLDIRIVISKSQVCFYGRPHGTECWNLVYQSNCGALSVTGAQIKMVDNNPSGGEYPRMDSVYVGYSNDFGRQWVRSHPFQIFAMAQLWGASSQITNTPAQFDQYYAEGGMNSLLVECQYTLDNLNQISIPAINLLKQHGMVWHGYLGTLTRTQALVQRVGVTSTAQDDNGWFITDEPNLSACAGIGLVRDWIKERRPNALVYANAHPSTCLDEAWMEGFVSQIRPDVLMFDHYPYYDDTHWYADLADGIEMYPYIAAYRAKALERRLPLWAWLQTWYGPTMESHRASSFPSDSDLRKQVFVYLAAGVKGFSYFIYDSTDNWLIGLINIDGTKTPSRDGSTLFQHVANVNPEIENIGNYLKYLESTDICFIPGLAANATPSGLNNWSLGAGGENRILSFGVRSPTAKTNGFIGFFTDDTGQKYFMLTNLNSGRTLTSEQTATTFDITFDGSVSGVYRLNRSTGQQEWIPVNGGVLTVNLPGGTGDLFTISAAAFDLAPPTGSVAIESGASYTATADVMLALTASDDRGALQMRFSNDNSTWSQWETYSTSRAWTLISGEGVKTVYVQFKDGFGRISSVISDTITLGSKVQNPEFTPESRSFAAGTTQLVTITCPTPGASIYYSTDGSEPSVLYTLPVQISSSITLKAVATKAGAVSSDIITASYSFLTPTSKVPGIDVSGILVRVWGRVTGVGGSGSDKYFYIDDGSNLYDGNEAGYFGVRILADMISMTIVPGSYAGVTGIVRPWKVGEEVTRAVHSLGDTNTIVY